MSFRRFGRSCATVLALVGITVALATATASATTHTPPLFNKHNGLPYGYTELAAINHPVFEYSSPGHRTDRVLSNKYKGAPLTVPVVLSSKGYLYVRLPQRPNGQEAWIKASQVIVGATPYLILVNVKSAHLKLYRRGKMIMNAPVGVGTKSDPTPTGRFFVAFFAEPPNPGYGPFVLVTSGHSNKITDWDLSGDAMVAIHGPLGDDREIGKHGARVSHGCIRMHVAQQRKLQHVPVGTPVVIIN